MSRNTGPRASRRHDQATRKLDTLLHEPRVKGLVRVRDREIRTFTPRTAVIVPGAGAHQRGPGSPRAGFSATATTLMAVIVRGICPA
jgi:hypothetical protein